MSINELKEQSKIWKEKTKKLLQEKETAKKEIEKYERQYYTWKLSQLKKQHKQVEKELKGTENEMNQCSK